MTTSKLFPARRWYEKVCCSQDELNTSAIKGLISREIVKSNDYGSWYKFSTLEGVEIATFYKDSTYGFSTQAYGVDIPANIVTWI